MPLYEYKCHRCGEVFEVLQKFSDTPLKVHAACGGDVERLLAAPAFQFKGTGWYITDYARKHNSNGSNGHGTKEIAPAKQETSAAKPESKPSSSESTTKKS